SLFARLGNSVSTSPIINSLRLEIWPFGDAERAFCQFLPVAQGNAGSAGAQVLDRLVAAEEVEQHPQRPAALAFEVRVALEHEAGVVMGDRDQLLMGGEIGKPQARQPALPRPQYLARTAQAQILLGDAKPVLGLAQDLEPPFGDGAERRLVEQQA